MHKLPPELYTTSLLHTLCGRILPYTLNLSEVCPRHATFTTWQACVTKKIKSMKPFKKNIPILV